MVSIVVFFINLYFRFLCQPHTNCSQSEQYGPNPRCMSVYYERILINVNTNAVLLPLLFFLLKKTTTSRPIAIILVQFTKLCTSIWSEKDWPTLSKV